MTDLALSESPGTGELLDGRYRLDARIGEGGMATVYRARDEMLGRAVAVKVFRPSVADPVSSGRTMSETRVLASLNHHSLVTLFDAKVDGDDSYLVMEYIDGLTLRERIEQGPIDRLDVQMMAVDLSEALHVVHRAGIIHRDIKPSNVLLRGTVTPGTAFRAKLADFGIAHLVDSTRVTTPGTVVGTVAYLSPEQVRGTSPDPASDIYSLGLVLIESLTGERAFRQTTTPELLAARLARAPEVPQHAGPNWVDLLAAMTARNPGDRPTALEVNAAARDLDVLSPAHDRTSPPRTTTMPSALETTRALSDDSIPTDGVASPITDDRTRTHRHPTTRARLIVIAIVALVILGLIVGGFIWLLATSTAAPTLPSLDEPLRTHFQQLLDGVSP
jgi:serine/threonine protein kinase